MSETAAAAAVGAAPASTSVQAQQSTDPSDIAWQFVPQYYTFVSKQPERLHCFYKKTSTFLHGTESEELQACNGQHEIHEKIMSMGFEDCKVYIHCADAQASVGGGIVIQVIGELSNRGEPWRKFVQTFFLAEQPKGYYIYNDIFRYLREQSVEDDEPVEGEDGVPAETEEQVDQAAPVEAPLSEPVVEAPAESVESIEEPVREPTPAPEPEAVPEEPPSTQPQPNGIHEEPVEEAAESVEETPTVPEPEEEEEPAPPAPVQASPAPAPAQAAQPPPAAAEKPVQAQAPPQQQQQKPAEPEKPAGPRTWANLAAANSKKWSSNLATESRGMSVEAAPSPIPAPAPSRSTNQTPISSSGAQSGGGQQGHTAPRNVREIAASLTRGEVFVKGLIDPITNQDLENILSKYGKIKSKEFVRNRAIAFFEYEDVESARAAIIESGNQGAGGGGGIFYHPPNGGQSLRIVVDVKREKGDKDRPPARPRQGGIPNQPSSDRGGFQRGRGGGGTRGRGAPTGK